MKIIIRGLLLVGFGQLSGFSIIRGVDRTVYALDHMRASEEEMRALVHVYDEVLENYVDVKEASPATLMQGAIFGMLQTLDPFPCRSLLCGLLASRKFRFLLELTL